jgi:zinc D-Ala-D-Ala carboxypeptidase
VDGYGITKTTTRRRTGTRRCAVRIAGPALGLLLTVTAGAVPARAATTPATAAGVTWAQLMHRKLDLAANAVRLKTLLPDLRATVVARNADLAEAQRTLMTAAATAATANTADQNARSRQLTAKTAATAAKKALAVEQKRRPSSKSRLAKAKQTLTTAEATVRARAVTAGRTTSALRTARTAYTATADALVTATAGYQAAAATVTGTEQRIAAQPALDKTLAAQAVALNQQVVTQTRATFTPATTTLVYGVTVNKIIAYPFQRMIDDAAKAGIQLSGGGFRTRQQQVGLRTINGCPDVWTAPASACRVPTAIPGRSLHELGLAIDISSGRKSITDRKSPAFKWLAANAARYGLINLPAEPWHWSITGG